MKCGTWSLLLLILLWPGISRGEEPVIGGPCEGCELVFAGMPDQIGAHSRIAPDDEKGEPLVVEGMVKGVDGLPAPGIIVYAYHTDDSGIYPRGTTRHGRLRSWARTDEAGKYRFDTIRPGSYPNGGAPAHIHMHVIEPGKGTYYIDDIVFDDDKLVTDEYESRVQSRGGSGVTHPEKDDDGVWRLRRDITLGENVPGYE